MQRSQEAQKWTCYLTISAINLKRSCSYETQQAVNNPSSPITNTRAALRGPVETVGKSHKPHVGPKISVTVFRPLARTTALRSVVAPVCIYTVCIYMGCSG